MSAHSTEYHRYHIEARNAPGIARWPTRFRVRVGRVGLAKHLLSELVKNRLNMEVVLSRPCLYGTLLRSDWRFCASSGVLRGLFALHE